MKNHLKRIASPKSWVINRKQGMFIVRPNPGAHTFADGLSLGIVLRDMLGLASTMNEVKKLLVSEDVLVDGKKRKDHRFIVGLFDIISSPKLKQHYRLIPNRKGRIVAKGIPENESGFKVCKIIGKKILSGGRIQFNLHDGKNIVSDKKASVGDSLVLSVPKQVVQQVLALQPNVTVFLQKGKHVGDIGILKEVKKNIAIYEKDKQVIETSKAYIFVIGGAKPQKPIINLGSD